MVRILKNMVKDMIDQAWTLLGMFIAWVVLDGSAKTIVGYGIIATTALWILTSPARNKEEKYNTDYEENVSTAINHSLIYVFNFLRYVRK